MAKFILDTLFYTALRGFGAEFGTDGWTRTSGLRILYDPRLSAFAKYAALLPAELHPSDCVEI